MLNFHTEIRELELGQRVWIGANSEITMMLMLIIMLMMLMMPMMLMMTMMAM